MFFNKTRIPNITNKAWVGDQLARQSPLAPCPLGWLVVLFLHICLFLLETSSRYDFFCKIIYWISICPYFVWVEVFIRLDWLDEFECSNPLAELKLLFKGGQIKNYIYTLINKTTSTIINMYSTPRRGVAYRGPSLALSLFESNYLYWFWITRSL